MPAMLCPIESFLFHRIKTSNHKRNAVIWMSYFAQWNSFSHVSCIMYNKMAYLIKDRYNILNKGCLKELNA